MWFSEFKLHLSESKYGTQNLMGDIETGLTSNKKMIIIVTQMRDGNKFVY